MVKNFKDGLKKTKYVDMENYTIPMEMLKKGIFQLIKFKNDN